MPSRTLPVPRPSPQCRPVKLDVNTASQAALETLPGIGPALARLIIAGRPYRLVEDLGTVSGIGAKTVERLRPLVRVG